MSWTYQGKTIKDISDFPPNSFGFVYVITHLETNKKYNAAKWLNDANSKIRNLLKYLMGYTTQ